MDTIKYWGKIIIWHPLDIADKILVLVGGVTGYLQKGNDPMTYHLSWQIPLGAILLLLIWRLLQVPVKIKDDIRRERAGLPPLTLEGVSQRIVDIENSVRSIKEKVEPAITNNI